MKSQAPSTKSQTLGIGIFKDMPRLLQQFRKKILPVLQSELKLTNALAVPKIEKIVVNSGIGKNLLAEPKSLDQITEAVKKITGQKPVLKKAKKAISGFKVREGQVVGLVVTLRGQRMYDFLDKFINVALPRSRDFKGLSKAGFDGRGNYSAGIRDYLVFPEMVQEDSGMDLGLQITIITTAKDDQVAYVLLKKFGFPFKD